MTQKKPKTPKKQTSPKTPKILFAAGISLFLIPIVVLLVGEASDSFDLSIGLLLYPAYAIRFVFYALWPAFLFIVVSAILLSIFYKKFTIFFVSASFFLISALYTGFLLLAFLRQL